MSRNCSAASRGASSLGSGLGGEPGAVPFLVYDLKTADGDSLEGSGFETVVRLLKRDWRAKRTPVRKDWWKVGAQARGDRGPIVGLSASAARALELAVRNAEGLAVLLTVTYPADFPMDGRKVKRDWRTFAQWVADYSRRSCPSPVQGLWFLEFQARGAPHFHALLTGRLPFAEVRRAWSRIVAEGAPGHPLLRVRVERLREPHAAAVYAAKYAVKARQKEPPEGFRNVGKMWGYMGGLKVVPTAVVKGPSEVVAPLLRAGRGLVDSRRRGAGRQAFRDSGRGSVTLRDVGGLSKRLLEVLPASAGQAEE